MKKLSLLALLSLSLAACTQGTTPAASTHVTQGIVANDPSHVTYGSTQAAYDALLNADLQRLGTLSTAPNAYLNVLPIPASADSVRAYVKTSYPSPVTTEINWGDGSPLTDLATPTTTRIDTRNHAYATFGTYTVTLTSTNGSGVVVDTRSVTLQAGKRATGPTITFDSPAAPSGAYNQYTSYQEAGFNFTNTASPVYQFAKDFGGAGRYNLGNSQTLYAVSQNDSLVMTSVGGTPFTLRSLEAREVFHGQTNDYVITGHRADSSSVSIRTQEVPDGVDVVTFDSAWTNLTSVTFGNPGNIILDNINATH